MLNYIEHIVYINLDHRKDRKDNIEKVLSVFPADRVHRFSAIKHQVGAIGCSKSHIAALKLAHAEGWSNVLILEDDAIWSNLETGIKIFNSIVTHPFDVILLGATYADYNKDTYQLSYGQTATAYIVNKDYYETLLENFEKGLSLLERTGRIDIFAVDIFWQHLQAKDNWYVVAPSLMIQKADYSDINQSMVSYESSFV